MSTVTSSQATSVRQTHLQAVKPVQISNSKSVYWGTVKRIYELVDKHHPTTDILSKIDALMGRKEVLSNVKINRAIALDLLTRNIDNRPLSNVQISRWSGKMKDNKWIPNGKNICFTNEGFMIDGQHTLYAIIDSDTEQEMNIQTGLPPESYLVMDIGKPRSGGDTYANEGYPDYNIMAAAVKSYILLQIEGQISSNIHYHKVDNQTLKEWTKTNPVTKMVYSVSLSKTFHKNGTFMARSTWAFVHYALSRVKGERVEVERQAYEFLEMLSKGDNWPHEKDKIIHKLRERLIQISKDATQNRDLNLRVKFIFHAWNLWRKGKPIKQLRVAPEAEIEKPK